MQPDPIPAPNTSEEKEITLLVSLVVQPVLPIVRSSQVSHSLHGSTVLFIIAEVLVVLIRQ